MFIKHIKLSFNNCLYKKVGIDIDGNIKNCPSDKKIYGNVNTDSIQKVIQTEEFKKKWSLKKDMIETCKICEFRYVCTDCRVFTSNESKNENLSKPEKCNYDPWTGVCEK